MNQYNRINILFSLGLAQLVEHLTVVVMYSKSKCHWFESGNREE